MSGVSTKRGEEERAAVKPEIHEKREVSEVL